MKPYQQNNFVIYNFLLGRPRFKKSLKILTLSLGRAGICEVFNKRKQTHTYAHMKYLFYYGTNHYTFLHTNDMACTVLNVFFAVRNLCSTTTSAGQNEKFSLADVTRRWPMGSKLIVLLRCLLIILFDLPD